MKNMNFEITKAIIAITSVSFVVYLIFLQMLYPSCVYRIVVLNSSYVTRSASAPIFPAATGRHWTATGPIRPNSSAR